MAERSLDCLQPRSVIAGRAGQARARRSSDSVAIAEHPAAGNLRNTSGSAIWEEIVGSIGGNARWAG